MMKQNQLPLIFGVIALFIVGVTSVVALRAAASARASLADAPSGPAAITPPSDGEQRTLRQVGPPPAPRTPERPYIPDSPALAAFLDKRGGGERLPADFEALVPVVRDERDIAAVVALAGDVSDVDEVRNEALNLLRRSDHPALVAELFAIVDNPLEGPRFRSFAVQHLGLCAVSARPDGEAEAICERLRAMLVDRHAPVRRDALLALVRLRDERGLGILRQALDDPAWASATDLVIGCLYEADVREAIPAIRPYLRSSDEAVRIAAISALAQWRDESSRDEFASAAGAPSERLRRAGERALRALAAPSPSSDPQR
jgi:HEAT repeat protein